MPIARRFLGWSGSGLDLAARELLRTPPKGGLLDLSAMVVVVPGSRAGRRLHERLTSLSESREIALVPPRIVTLGLLPELLYDAQRPFAERSTRELAWVQALHATPPDQRQLVIHHPPQRDDLSAWLPFAELLDRLHRELAADGLSFRDGEAGLLKLGATADAARFAALAAIEERYLHLLDNLGLWDKQTARLFAVRHREPRARGPIVLLGTVDMDVTQRSMLDQVADGVTALILAPAELADRFDSHGCLVPEAWAGAQIPLSDDQIDVVDGPADQADAAVRRLAALRDRHATDDVVLGVLDTALVPYLEQRFHEGGLEARYGAGTPWTASGVGQFLQAVAGYLDGQSYPSLAALLRHPQLEAWLRSQGIPESALLEADAYFSAHLPTRATDRWLARQDEYPGLRGALDALQRLFEPLSGPLRPMTDQLSAILGLVQAVYGVSEFLESDRTARGIILSLSALRDAAAELVRVPGWLAPRCSAALAIRLLLRTLATSNIPPPQLPGSVELLGWLELPLDEAPVVIVTGLNEGIVPSSLNGDPFLPDRLRRQLGLVDNQRRYARDAYTLALLMGSGRELRLIAGRRTVDGDPLFPSRLLFACDDQTAARRVQSFFHPRPCPRARLTHSWTAGSVQPRFEVPRPRPLESRVESMRVTEFRDYLACPYRYYLTARLRLETQDDAAEELDSAGFGSMLHTVLSRFGHSTDRDTTDADQLRELLRELLGDVLRQVYGDQPQPAVVIQAELMAQRLDAFAKWQAAWRAQGWTIHSVEREREQFEVPFQVDDKVMKLRGRIDRIDRRGDAEFAIFDYKSASDPADPSKSHYDAKQGIWLDLQLPLYRHLASLGLKLEATSLLLGYIQLPKEVTKTGEALATWTQEQLEAADDVARDVIRRVWREEFWPKADKPPAFSDALAAICQDGRLPPRDDDDDKEGE